MDHVLDNPAWNAHVSGNKQLSNGNEFVRYFNENVAPFVGLKENSTEDFQILNELIPQDRVVVFISTLEMQIPAEWKNLQYLNILQMVYDQPELPAAVEIEPMLLEEKHIPEMLALTKLTNPGPFFERTIDFGHYYGVFEDGKLVAMAGQRMNPSPYAEISAVCTHPDYLGRGYAKQLLLYHIHRIKSASEIPFLHVRRNNERAVKVYEHTGFITRKELHFYVLQKA